MSERSLTFSLGFSSTNVYLQEMVAMKIHSVTIVRFLATYALNYSIIHKGRCRRVDLCI